MSLSGPRTSLLPAPGGDLEVLTTGKGDPHSLFVHGLAGSISTTRPYASAVRGTCSFVHQRGHGRSFTPATEDWGYAELAADVRAVADQLGADRALGVSMGAGALLALLAEDPDRFERVVLVLPALIDRPRGDEAMRRLGSLAARVEAGDPGPVARHLLGEQPAAVRTDPRVVAWCREQAEHLVTTGVAGVLRVLPDRVPVIDRSVLARVTCPVLVVGQEDDDLHPAPVARELGEVLSSVTVRILPPGGIMWEHRRATRELVGEFLSAP